MGPQVLPAADAAPAIDWAKYKIGGQFAPLMFISHWAGGVGAWSEGEVVPYGPLPMMPSAQVLNYGQSIFEGSKAYRSAKANLVVFRPELNAARMAAGAERMAMPPVPTALYIRAVDEVVRANAELVPPTETGGSLYLRPLLMGTGEQLGLVPAHDYVFCLYAAPVATRLRDGLYVPVDFKIEESIHRAPPRGAGGTKAAGNYSPVLVAQAEARKAGFYDVFYLDAKHDLYLEEGSGCNVAIVRGNKVTTPAAVGSILPGITRLSILELAKQLGYEAEEAPVTVHEAMEADECFCTGTAVIVMPVGSITYRGTKKEFVGFGTGQAGPVASRLFKALNDIHYEHAEGPAGWMHIIPQDAGDAARYAAILAPAAATPHLSMGTSKSFCQPPPSELPTALLS